MVYHFKLIFLEIKYKGTTWAEGPAWNFEKDQLIWSDVPQNKMYCLNSDSSVIIFKEKSDYNNGNFIDQEGRLVSCQHGKRRVIRKEKSGKNTIIADNYQGKKLNSPNDVVVKSDGTIWFTDPPYGMSYKSNFREKTPKFNQIENDNIILSDWLPLANSFSKGFCFIWTSWKVLDKWLEVTKPLGDISNLVVWHKKGGGLGDLKATYLTDHEIALVFNRKSFLTGKRLGSVWEVSKDSVNKYLHPTQKPVELAEMAINTTTLVGNIILDFFGGSGSTLIAAERTHRHAYLMELDPKYCDVIVKRWEDFTGNTAKRVSSN